MSRLNPLGDTEPKQEKPYRLSDHEAVSLFGEEVVQNARTAGQQTTWITIDKKSLELVLLYEEKDNVYAVMPTAQHPTTEWARTRSYLQSCGVGRVEEPFS